MLVEKMERFLGMDMVSKTETEKMTEVPGSTVLPCMEGCTSGEEFTSRMKKLAAETGHPLAEASFYSARRLDVADPGTYVAAALTAYKMLLQSAEVLKVEDALAMVRNIAGRESLFGGDPQSSPSGRSLSFQQPPMKMNVPLAFYTLLALSPSLTAEEKASLSIDTEIEPWPVRFLDAEWTGNDL